MKKIYLFSGLGADERVFQFLDLSGSDTSSIKWIAPIKNEAIESYAKRLTDQVHFEKPILIGLSFGGMMAVELAKIIATEKVILISSVKTRNEMPLLYRVAGNLRLHKLVPPTLLKKHNLFIDWLFGIESKEEKELLKNIIADTDPVFLRWAIDKIVNWKNETEPPNILHIHGTKDRLLPIRNVDCDIRVEGGGHFMTVNKAKEISEVLRKLLA